MFTVKWGCIIAQCPSFYIFAFIVLPDVFLVRINKIVLSMSFFQSRNIEFHPLPIQSYIDLPVESVPAKTNKVLYFCLCYNFRNRDVITSLNLLLLVRKCKFSARSLYCQQKERMRLFTFLPLILLLSLVPYFHKKKNNIKLIKKLF